MRNGSVVFAMGWSSTVSGIFTRSPAAAASVSLTAAKRLPQSTFWAASKPKRTKQPEAWPKRAVACQELHQRRAFSHRKQRLFKRLHHCFDASKLVYASAFSGLGQAAHTVPACVVARLRLGRAPLANSLTRIAHRPDNAARAEFARCSRIHENSLDAACRDGPRFLTQSAATTGREATRA